MKKPEFNELLTKLKSLLFADEKPADDIPAGTEVKAKDGALYSVDKLEVGGVMSSKNDAGELSVVPAGSYELEDGTIVTTSEGGVIAEIKPVEAPAETSIEAAEDKPTDAPAETVSKADFDSLAQKVADLEALLTTSAANLADASAQFTEVKKENAKFSETLKAAFAVIDALANESTEKPTSTSKTLAFKSNEKEAALSKLKEAIDKAFEKK